MYIPTYFTKEEIFSKSVVDAEQNRGSNIWRLMDNRVLWTIDRIRVHFCGYSPNDSHDVMTVNNWSWGGHNQLRGLRHLEYDAAKMEGNFSTTSQHVFGRAADFTLGKTTAEEVRQDILKNPNAIRYRYITAIEMDVNWVHFDVRNRNKDEEGIFTFGR